MPIGMQNAFVLNQGIMRSHHYLVAGLCALIDLLLVSMAVYGVGYVFTAQPLLQKGLMLLGCAYMLIYGSKCLHRCIIGHTPDRATTFHQKSRRQTVLTTLSVTLFNPHVYLDTLIIWGGYAAALHSNSRSLFVAGGASASFCWFFFLAIGGAYLSPWLNNRRCQQVLDAFIGLSMFVLTSQLLQTLF
ncbi:MAG: Arginine exporter protein ArgO [Candidatus Celerinatantimonas neptuna]|nr:MAG: Arginine exporter protein ArgO [Candidatus Celerinatantimonas neptuna]